ncbi:MAG: hypothetical protein IPM56_05050 [Ignavibacteriales bacterium]|nr:MAG: hypothetical protein IPM56_05050 [Ignavibacteriales bacterium]
MKPKIFLLLFLSLYIVNCTLYITHATTRYVSKTGSSTPPYTSWETAADSIQKAIDVSWIDDTIIVAKGVYYESLYINRTIHLIGSSMDSTIIDATNNTEPNIIYFYNNNSSMKYFYLLNSLPGRIGINTRNSNIKAEFCRTKNLTAALSINFSSVHISNFIIRAYNRAIRDECPADTCHSVYMNNIIYGENVSETPVLFAFGGKPTFINNIVFESGYCLRGVDLQYISGGVIKNNLVSGYEGVNIRAGQIVADTVYFENNISLNSEIGYSTSTAHRTVIRNNIAKDVLKGIQASNGAVAPDYNLFWNVGELTGGTASLGNNNIFTDPMFVKAQYQELAEHTIYICRSIHLQ